MREPQDGFRDRVVESYVWSRMAPGSGRVAVTIAIIGLIAALLICGYIAYQDSNLPPIPSPTLNLP